MGISLSFLKFFDICYQYNALVDPMLALGSLEINDPPELLRDFVRTGSYWKRAEDLTIRSLLAHRYDIVHYSDCDLNDRADIKIDLNEPVPGKLANAFMTIINGGTLEHIFNVPRAFENIHRMTKERGTVIHLVPITWYEHAYYNFNPRLFRELAEVNQYALVAEAFWSNHDLSKLLDGDLSRNDTGQEFSQPSSYVTYDGRQVTSFAEKISRMLSQSYIPANIVYMVAYRKLTSKSFNFPYDVSG